MLLTSTVIQTSHGFSLRDVTVAKLTKKLGAKKLITAKQVHSNIVHFIEGEGAYEGDALVTNTLGLAVGVYTADCAPVLLHDKKAGLVGAVHAGWKGARYGIIENTIKLMKEKGAEKIIAAIGPCIHQNSYEVDKKFLEVFMAEKKTNQKYFVPSQKAGHLMFDLPAYVKNKLIAAGAKKVDMLDQDTLSQPEKFCSYRRGTLAGTKETGRQLSAICLGIK